MSKTKIDPRDLRLGNYLKDRQGRLCKAESISTEEGTNAPAIQGAITSLPLEPIPLSEQWLIDFGFKKLEQNLFCYDNYIYANAEDNDWKDLCLDITIKRKGQSITYLTCVIFVHELQNLIRYISGKELELNK